MLPPRCAIFLFSVKPWGSAVLANSVTASNFSCRQLKLEAVTELANTADPQGFTENKKIAQRGGSITEDERNKYAQWNY